MRLSPESVSYAEPDKGLCDELSRTLSVSPAIAQVLASRGFENAEAAERYLRPKFADLSPPDAMADRDAASERLARAVKHRERVVIFGDYDVDGTTSAAILYELLSSLGVDARPMIADRFRGGYGFSDHALSRVLAEGPSLVVTCDCGSSDHPRLAELRQRGVDAIVVDHHLVPEEPLPALAFINPHRPDCGFPYKMMASAGLALVLAGAMRQALDVRLDLRRWLDLVALGTVADVAPLDGDNRTLVRAGLSSLAKAGVRPGVRCLIEHARIKTAGLPLLAEDISFGLAPRLNAGGRLGDAESTLALLLSKSETEARRFAVQVERNNEERRRLEREASEEAVQQVREVYGPQPSGGVVVWGESWHRGVVGIVAARLVDKFNVPAIAIAADGASGKAHGSGRTPRGFRLYDAISAASSHLERFGGHQAAAGLTLPLAHLETFRSDFSSQTRDFAPSPQSFHVEWRAGENENALPPASQLALLEPLGAANVAPLCSLKGQLQGSPRVVGERHLRFDLRVAGMQVPVFGPNASESLSSLPRSGEFLGYLRPDRYRGGENVELCFKGIIG